MSEMLTLSMSICYYSHQVILSISQHLITEKVFKNASIGDVNMQAVLIGICC